MKTLLREIKSFCECKFYVIGLALVALFAYGYAVTHYAIGMDDTVIELYFEEGLAPYVGRWTLFLINKVFHLSEFMPWMVELVSVIVLMVSVTLWCVLWKRICGSKVVLPAWCYFFVAAIFISCPLISEIFVFYLHNGVCLGYGVTALAVLCLLDAMKVGATGKYRVGQLVLSAVLLAVALGFYESFVIVYIMGAIMCFFLIRCLYGRKGEDAEWNAALLPWMGGGLLTLLGSVVLRTVILKLINVAFGLEKLERYNVLYRSFFGDIFTAEGELAMVLKRFFLKYYVNAIVYLPIAVLVAAIGFIGLYAVCYAVKKKDILLLVCAGVMVLLPVLMSLVEGLATRYRTAQYVPLVGAFAVLLLLTELHRRKLPAWIPVCCYFLLGVLLFNQCADMNSQFYADDLKYQDAKKVMEQVAQDLEEGYDTSKPIVFRGAYTVPYEFCGNAYVGFGSREYQLISKLTAPIDPYLTSKYFIPVGYSYAESPLVSVLQWGVTAFDGTSQQLIEFWKMHGYDSYRCVTDLEVIAEAEQIRCERNMPGYPKAGYILECEDYIIINMSDL